MNDDLVERLRKYAADPYNFRDVHGSAQASSEAADEIERLKLLVEAQRRVLSSIDRSHERMTAERDALKQDAKETP